MHIASHGVARLLNDPFCINTSLPGSFVVVVADGDGVDGGEEETTTQPLQPLRI